MNDTGSDCRPGGDLNSDHSPSAFRRRDHNVAARGRIRCSEGRYICCNFHRVSQPVRRCCGMIETCQRRRRNGRNDGSHLNGRSAGQAVDVPGHNGDIVETLRHHTIRSICTSSGGHLRSSLGVCENCQAVHKSGSLVHDLQVISLRSNSEWQPCIPISSLKRRCEGGSCVSSGTGSRCHRCPIAEHDRAPDNGSVGERDDLVGGGRGAGAQHRCRPIGVHRGVCEWRSGGTDRARNCDVVTGALARSWAKADGIFLHGLADNCHSIPSI
mmetsp:Transcript_29575/g.75847  ORF Transcript_29575/g.75847 Transcript_29575/m.75847 type:complete len:270 (-) Transcript_29575:1365-2174(-)